MNYLGEDVVGLVSTCAGFLDAFHRATSCPTGGRSLQNSFGRPPPFLPAARFPVPHLREPRATEKEGGHSSQRRSPSTLFFHPGNFPRRRRFQFLGRRRLGENSIRGNLDGSSRVRAGALLANAVAPPLTLEMKKVKPKPRRKSTAPLKPRGPRRLLLVKKPKP